jgi:hypothetical protein
MKQRLRKKMKKTRCECGRKLESQICWYCLYQLEVEKNKTLKEDNERYKKRNKEFTVKHSTVCNIIDRLKKGKMTIEELSK